MTEKIRASEELLGLLHEAVARDLLEKIQAGTATPAEINEAIKFLQNNGIEAVVGTGGTLDTLADALPKFDDYEFESENIQ